MADKETTELQKQETQLPEGVERTKEGKLFLPAVDIYETNDSVVLVADMPGVGADDVDLTLESNVLTVTGRVETPHDEPEAVYLEYETGDFQRSFTLSEDVDADGIEANMANGVLTLTLPKAAPTRKRIEVKAG